MEFEHHQMWWWLSHWHWPQENLHEGSSQSPVNCDSRLETGSSLMRFKRIPISPIDGSIICIDRVALGLI